MIGKLRGSILGAAVAVSAFGVGGSKCDAGGPSVGSGVFVNIDPVAIANSITAAVGSAGIARASSRPPWPRRSKSPGGATM